MEAQRATVTGNGPTASCEGSGALERNGKNLVFFSPVPEDPPPGGGGGAGVGSSATYRGCVGGGGSPSAHGSSLSPRLSCRSAGVGFPSTPQEQSSYLKRTGCAQGPPSPHPFTLDPLWPSARSSGGRPPARPRGRRSQRGPQRMN